MNSILEVMEKRKSIRKFDKENLKEEHLEIILQGGRLAPSGGNTRTSRLFVIQNPHIQVQLRELVQQEFAAMEYDEHTYKSLVNSIQASKRGNYHYDYNAPVLVVVANLKSYPNAMADTSCILENMMLAATSIEVASCWINQLHWLEDKTSIRDVLKPYGLEDDLTICGALALGYSPLVTTLKMKNKEGGNPVIYIR
jgi:nitroreductase